MNAAAVSQDILDLKEQAERDTSKRLAAKVGLFVKQRQHRNPPKTTVLVWTDARRLPTLGSHLKRNWHRVFANWTEASVFLTRVAELFGGPEFPWGMSRHPDLEALQMREQVLRLENVLEPELGIDG